VTSTYERQLALAQGLPRPDDDRNRSIEWGESGGALGLARTSKGRIEIFLPGEMLEARFRKVRDALEYQRWFRTNGEELLANRILLPAAGHFEQVAAFLSTELLRNGAVEDMPRAFAITEPLIELAIEDLLLADDTYVGLCGEVLVLRALVRAAPDNRVGDVLDAWHGYRETSRDLQLDAVGVEVKTTSRATSSHVFGGVQQLEIGHGVDGREESSYTLMSLGLEWTDAGDSGGSTSLPELVDGLIARATIALGASAATYVDDLLARLAEYGAARRLGYDHTTMAESMRFARRFRLRFARGYDMADGAIALLTADDLRARPFIEPESLFLRVNLPDQVRGDLNPVTGLANCADSILRASLWTD
jgi:hypothetical protein